MKFVVELTQSELVEMDATAEQIRKGIVNLLDGGIDLEDDDGSSGTLYLAGFNVELKIVE